MRGLSVRTSFVMVYLACLPVMGFTISPTARLATCLVPGVHIILLSLVAVVAAAAMCRRERLAAATFAVSTITSGIFTPLAAASIQGFLVDQCNTQAGSVRSTIATGFLSLVSVLHVAFVIKAALDFASPQRPSDITTDTSCGAVPCAHLDADVPPEAATASPTLQLPGPVASTEPPDPTPPAAKAPDWACQAAPPPCCAAAIMSLPAPASSPGAARAPEALLIHHSARGAATTRPLAAAHDGAAAGVPPYCPLTARKLISMKVHDPRAYDHRAAITASVTRALAATLPRGRATLTGIAAVRGSLQLVITVLQVDDGGGGTHAYKPGLADSTAAPAHHGAAAAAAANALRRMKLPEELPAGVVSKGDDGAGVRHESREVAALEALIAALPEGSRTPCVVRVLGEGAEGGLEVVVEPGCGEAAASAAPGAAADVEVVWHAGALEEGWRELLVAPLCVAAGLGVAQEVAVEMAGGARGLLGGSDDGGSGDGSGCGGGDGGGQLVVVVQRAGASEHCSVIVDTRDGGLHSRLALPPTLDAAPLTLYLLSARTPGLVLASATTMALPPAAARELAAHLAETPPSDVPRTRASLRGLLTDWAALCCIPATAATPQPPEQHASATFAAPDEQLRLSLAGHLLDYLHSIDLPSCEAALRAAFPGAPPPTPPAPARPRAPPTTSPSCPTTPRAAPPPPAPHQRPPAPTSRIADLLASTLLPLLTLLCTLVLAPHPWSSGASSSPPAPLPPPTPHPPAIVTSLHALLLAVPPAFLAIAPPSLRARRTTFLMATATARAALHLLVWLQPALRSLALATPLQHPLPHLLLFGLLRPCLCQLPWHTQALLTAIEEAGHSLLPPLAPPHSPPSPSPTIRRRLLLALATVTLATCTAGVNCLTQAAVHRGAVHQGAAQPTGAPPTAMAATPHAAASAGEPHPLLRGLLPCGVCHHLLPGHTTAPASTPRSKKDN